MRSRHCEERFPRRSKILRLSIPCPANERQFPRSRSSREPGTCRALGITTLVRCQRAVRSDGYYSPLPPHCTEAMRPFPLFFLDQLGWRCTLFCALVARPLPLLKVFLSRCKAGCVGAGQDCDSGLLLSVQTARWLLPTLWMRRAPVFCALWGSLSIVCLHPVLESSRMTGFLWDARLHAPLVSKHRGRRRVPGGRGALFFG